MGMVVFRRGVVAVVASSCLIQLSLAGEASAYGPPARIDRCGLEGAARAICVAFLAQHCDVSPRHSCDVLRRRYVSLTGSPFFPFEVPPTSPGVAGTGPHSGSLLVFPLVLATGERDTLIQIANISSSEIYALCFYLNGAPADPTQPVSATNPRQWQQIDYDIHLTSQQPTQWRVSAGRFVDATDSLTGIDPGNIPPVFAGFTGELRCLQTDDAGVPVGGNALTGTATLLGPAEEVASYDAFAFRGLAVDGDLTLHLDGAEYEACPGKMEFLHRADGPILPSLSVTNVFTVVPCTVDYLMQIPVHTKVAALFFDEFEEKYSGLLSSEYWDQFGSAQLVALEALGGVFKQAQLTPVGKLCVGGSKPGTNCTTDAQCGPAASCEQVPALVLLEETLRFSAGQELRAIDIQSPHFDGIPVNASMRLPPLFPSP
jgi:hypothetical protein